MPLTQTEWPILTQFLCVVEKSTGMPPQPLLSPGSSNHLQPSTLTDKRPRQLPRGVVLDKDGKPCRSCTSFAAWAQMTKSQTAAQAPTTTTTAPQTDLSLELPPDCPADVEALGRSTWTMLHTMTANYPSNPSRAMQQQTRSFIGLFSNLYPCHSCAEDFREWMKEERNAPRLSNREEFGRWMCEAHNAVNEKLGKDTFDCGKWEERWRTGPPDGRCG